jgi:hypothetical protein
MSAVPAPKHVLGVLVERLHDGRLVANVALVTGGAASTEVLVAHRRPHQFDPGLASDFADAVLEMLDDLDDSDLDDLVLAVHAPPVHDAELAAATGVMLGVGWGADLPVAWVWRVHALPTAPRVTGLDATPGLAAVIANATLLASQGQVPGWGDDDDDDEDGDGDDDFPDRAYFDRLLGVVS